MARPQLHAGRPITAISVKKAHQWWQQVLFEDTPPLHLFQGILMLGLSVNTSPPRCMTRNWKGSFTLLPLLSLSRQVQKTSINVAGEKKLCCLCQNLVLLVSGFLLLYSYTPQGTIGSLCLTPLASRGRSLQLPLKAAKPDVCSS